MPPPWPPPAGAALGSGISTNPTTSVVNPAAVPRFDAFTDFLQRGPRHLCRIDDAESFHQVLELAGQRDLCNRSELSFALEAPAAIYHRALFARHWQRSAATALPGHEAYDLCAGPLVAAERANQRLNCGYAPAHRVPRRPPGTIPPLPRPRASAMRCIFNARQPSSPSARSRSPRATLMMATPPTSFANRFPGKLFLVVV